MVLMFIFSGASGLSPNFYLYLASQFLVGIGYGGYRLNAVILGTLFISLLEFLSFSYFAAASSGKRVALAPLGPLWFR